MVLAALASALALLGASRLVRPQPATDELPAAVDKRLAFLRGAIDDGADIDAQRLFPEGYFFVNTLYGLAWVQVGLAAPDRTETALREARRALARAESADGTAPFSAGLRPAYGIFHAGWTNWLRGGVLSLQPPDHRDAAEVARFTSETGRIAAAFDAAATPYLQAYPGQAWPVDSTVAIASLRLHDRLLGARYDATVRRWLTAVRTRLDPATGLLPHQVDASTGTAVGGARATSQSIVQRFLPEIDQAFAAAQYQRFRDLFLAHPLGLGPAVREYPRGVDGPGDVDSGPLVLGVSLSATVVTLGAARVHNDRRLAGALGGIGELVGVPVSGPHSRRYAFGLLPVGDAFLVWSATSRPWVEPPRPPTIASVGRWWPIPWLALLAAGPAILWLLVWVTGRRRRLRSRRSVLPDTLAP